MNHFEVTPADLAEIAPYEGEAFREAMRRLAESPRLPKVIAGFFPNTDKGELVRLATASRDADEFHATVILIAIKSLLKRTSDGLTASGIEALDPKRRYVFLSNHRDIVADSALLSFSCAIRGLRTVKICLGDNLLADPWTTDLLKVNKGVIVKRDAKARELLRWSHVLSRYVRREIEEGVDSVWLAQREGRTKDGNDRTQTGVLKMLSLSGDGALVDRLRTLHIVPVAISYEYEPCGAFKIKQWLRSRSEGKYVKSEDEDARSMAAGVLGHKGRIHISVGKEIGDILDAAAGEGSKPDQLRRITAGIDEAIYAIYHLWPSNYVAADLLAGDSRFAGEYDGAQKEAFLGRMHTELASVGLDTDAGRELFLRMYAAPLENAHRSGV